MIGRTLTHYRVLEKIGQGGMGEVYLAEDTKLSRRVALKVLPAEMAQSESLRLRFEREAKAVAALNHPNIVTVHSVEEQDGIHFITMELVRGKNVAELLPDTGFPLERFFEIATPVVDAVVAAHRAGITHRDLKPENVMVSDEGRVTVLDFGLAKPQAGFALGDEGTDTPTLARTREGEIVGTPSYMSPEQVEGKQVDHRSDIFSLGILFYEMLTGIRPFAGDSAAAVLSSIMKDTPPTVAEVQSRAPAPLSRLVQRCLVKDPERRLQSAADLRNELEDLRVEPATGRTDKRWLMAAALLVLTAGVWMLLPRGDRDPVPRLTNPVQLTSAIGVEEYPSWSPDGRTLAYAATEAGDVFAGTWDIWVSQIASGDAVNRTADHAGADRFPVWSPDGSQIAFWSDRDGGGYYVISALGGTARRVVSDGDLSQASRPQWSADGSELACVVKRESESVAEIVSIETGASRRVPLPGIESNHRFDLAWSPDERFFSYVDAEDAASNAHRLWVTRLDDGTGAPVTDAFTNDWSPSWSADGTMLYYVSNRGGSMDFWQQPLGEDGIPDGDPQPITSGLVIRQAALSTDGKKLAYARGRGVANVWRVPILSDRPARWSDAEQMTFDQALIEFVDVSPNGEQILFDSDRGGNPDLWMMRVDGGEMVQVTRDPAADWDPKWSPDGRSVVFYSQRGGNRDIWFKPLDAGPLRQLTQHEAADLGASWAPDGEMVAFGSTRDGNVVQVFVIPAEGGPAQRITENPAGGGFPDWSPDGEWLVFERTSSGVSGTGAAGAEALYLVGASGGAEKRLTSGTGWAPTWSSDGKIYFKRERDLVTNIWEVRADGSGERPVTDLTGRRGRVGYERPSTDGKYLYFLWAENLSDLWVMDVVAN